MVEPTEAGWAPIPRSWVGHPELGGPPQSWVDPIEAGWCPIMWLGPELGCRKSGLTRKRVKPKVGGPPKLGAPPKLAGPPSKLGGAL